MTHTPPNILLVDDDKFLLDMYAMKFTKDGFNVHASLSVKEAVDTLKAGFAADAVVFDLTLPGEDGYALLEHLRDEKLAVGAKKIALTNQSTDDEKAKAMELGADDYYVKATMIPSEVVAKIRAALGIAAAAA
jgi:DNA-binding response OmpR family regulator